jgi:hypothetical protein
MPHDRPDPPMLLARTEPNLKSIDFFDLNTQETPREIIEADFPSVGDLPTSARWGYGQATACNISYRTATAENGCRLTRLNTV